jgi:hypothetical protein
MGRSRGRTAREGDNAGRGEHEDAPECGSGHVTPIDHWSMARRIALHPSVLMIKDADGHLTRHQQVSPSEFRAHQPSLSGFRKDEVQVLSASAESLVILERESNGVRLNLVISDEEEH